MIDGISMFLESWGIFIVVTRWIGIRKKMPPDIKLSKPNIETLIWNDFFFKVVTLRYFICISHSFAFAIYCIPIPLYSHSFAFAIHLYSPFICIRHSFVFAIHLYSPFICIRHSFVFAIHLHSPFICIRHSFVFAIHLYSPFICIRHSFAFAIHLYSPFICIR